MDHADSLVMQAKSRKAIPLFLIGISSIVLTAFFALMDSTFNPQKSLQKLFQEHRALPMQDWKMYFEHCPEDSQTEFRCQHVGDYSYSLALPNVEILTQILGGLAKPDASQAGPSKAYLTYILSDSDLMWLKQHETVDFVIPKAVQRSATIIVGQHQETLRGYYQDLTFRVKAADLRKAGKFQLVMQIEKLPWFGPPDFPMALVIPSYTSEYLSLTLRAIFSANLARAFSFGAVIVVVALGLILDHKKSFQLLGALLAIGTIRKLVPFLVESGYQFATWHILLIHACNLLTILLTPLFVVTVLNFRISRQSFALSVGVATGLYMAITLARTQLTSYLQADIMADLMACALGLACLGAYLHANIKQKLKYLQQFDYNAVATAKTVFLLLALGFHISLNVFELYGLLDTGIKNSMSLLVLAKPAFMMIAGMLDVGFTSKTMEQNARRYAHNELVAKDVEQSQLYQNQLIPSVAMQYDQWQAHTIYKPSLTLAGDWYDVREISLPDDSRYLAICLADVVGHGVSAGMVASVVASVWGVWVDKVASGHLTKEAASIPVAIQLLLGEMAGALAALRQKKDCSAAVLLVNLNSGEAHYATAGHPMMLHLSETGEPQGLHTNGGRIASGNLFQVKSTKVKAQDKLIVYSDGIISHNLPYSVWLRRIVKSPRPLVALANSIRMNRKIFTADRSLEDDMTMIVVTIKQIGQEALVAGSNQSDKILDVAQSA